MKAWRRLSTLKAEVWNKHQSQIFCLRPVKNLWLQVHSASVTLGISKKWKSPWKDFSTLLGLIQINEICPKAFNIFQISVYKCCWNWLWMMDYWTLILFLSDIMNQKGQLAWELYLKMGTSSDSFSLLQLIANDCYKVKSPSVLLPLTT